MFTEHIASSIGLILPIQRIIEICREKKISCVVDGNHVYGHIDVNIAQLDPGKLVFGYKIKTHTLLTAILGDM